MHMKIATYNVWNENKGRGNRFDQILKEIQKTDADVIGLQEVTPCFYEAYLRKKAGYAYSFFETYGDEEEGLAILSKYPLLNTFFLHKEGKSANGAAANVLFHAGGCRFSFTTTHLPWESALKKEELIVETDAFIHRQREREQVDFCLLAGDFNGSLNSSVHRFLLGEQSLNSCEAKPYWFELSSTYAALQGDRLKPTLDFLRNPRWEGKNSIEIPFAADRIYCMNCRKEMVLHKADIFGTEISPETGLSASDHYGVWAEMDFIK